MPRAASPVPSGAASRKRGRQRGHEAPPARRAEGVGLLGGEAEVARPGGRRQLGQRGGDRAQVTVERGTVGARGDQRGGPVQRGPGGVARGERGDQLRVVGGVVGQVGHVPSLTMAGPWVPEPHQGARASRRATSRATTSATPMSRIGDHEPPRGRGARRRRLGRDAPSAALVGRRRLRLEVDLPTTAAGSPAVETGGRGCGRGGLGDRPRRSPLRPRGPRLSGARGAAARGLPGRPPPPGPPGLRAGPVPPAPPGNRPPGGPAGARPGRPRRARCRAGPRAEPGRANAARRPRQPDGPERRPARG